MSDLRGRKFEREFKFRASKSSGKGGQHVNKVMTKAELVFNVPNSKILTIDEKILVKERLAHKLSTRGDLRIVTQLFRSQLKNKTICIDRFYRIMEKTLTIPKRRVPTEPGKQAAEKRLKKKHLMGERKRQRSKVDIRELE